MANKGFDELRKFTTGLNKVDFSGFNSKISSSTQAVQTFLTAIKGFSALAAKISKIQKLGKAFTGFNKALKTAVSAASLIALAAFVFKLSEILGVSPGVEAALKGLTAGFLAFKAAVAVQAVVKKATTAIKAAQAVMGLYAAGAKYATVANLALGKGTKALGTVMAFLTGKIKLATAAQIAKNIAMKANPVGLVIAGVAALAVGIVTLINRTRSQSEEQRRLNEETARLREKTDELIASIRNNSESYHDTARSIDNARTAQRNMVAELRRVMDLERQGKASRADVAKQVAILNQAMGDLNLQYDIESGLLNKNIGVIYNLIEARNRQAHSAEALERIVQVYEEQAEVAYRLYNIEAQLNAKRETGYDTKRRIVSSGFFIRSREMVVEYTEAYRDLLEQQAESIATQDYLAESYLNLKGVIGEATEGISEAKIRASEAAEKAAERHTQAMQSLADQVESTEQRASNAFGVMSQNTSVSMRRAAQNVLENTRLVIEQADNTATAMTRAMEKGVDEGVLRKLEEMANRGPGYAAMLANASDKEFAKLVDAWGASSEAAVHAVATQFGADEDVVREAAALANSTADSLRSELEAANISKMGENVALSLAKGIIKDTPEAAKAAEQMGLSIDEFVRYVLRISSPSKSFTQYGENLPTSLGAGIIDKTRKATDAISAMANKVVFIAESILTVTDATEWGNALISGLISSIDNGTHGVVSAITNMANSAVSAAHRALQIRSPSRIFAKMGENVTGTFAETVSSSKKIVDNAFDKLFTIDSDVLDPVLSVFDDLYGKIDFALKDTFENISSSFDKIENTRFDVATSFSATQMRNDFNIFDAFMENFMRNMYDTMISANSALDDTEKPINVNLQAMLNIDGRQLSSELERVRVDRGENIFDNGFALSL